MVFTGVKGDADAAFRDADYVRRERFAVQRYTALPMEPRGVLAEWDAAQGRMTVLGAAKVPFFNRDTLAAMLGLSPAQVDLIENDVGGGFGARGEFYPEDFLIPFAARHVGRPVRWIEDRREHLTAMNHARQADCEVEIACRSDGTILGLRGEVFVDLGAYVRTNGLIRRAPWRNASPAPIACRMCGSLLPRCSPTRRRPAPIARPAATRARSFASGLSSWRRATWGSTAPRCAGAT